MTVVPVPVQIDLLPALPMTSADTTPRGTWLAMGTAVALLLGRALLWLMWQLVKALVLMALVAAILTIGYTIASNWDSLTGAAPASAVIPPMGPIHHE